MTELETEREPFEVHPRSEFVSRPRRLRLTEGIRSLVSETDVSPRRLVMPIFVKEGSDLKEEIDSMPGVFRFSPDSRLDDEVREISDLGINSVVLFGIPNRKDATGSGAYSERGIIQQAVRRIKQSFSGMVVICDVCMCEYTEHGHCGVLNERGYVENDRTAELLGRIALSQAKAGADIVAPSAMMDNQVMKIRNSLDTNGFENTAIMSYSSKYSSSFYGPFRDAASSVPSFGDRKSYQMSPPNVREAIREAELDVKQGADIIMVKPALPYLDVIRAVRENFNLPLAAYSVSGEYSMIKSAALRGWLDETRAMDETLTAIRRSGADIIITYFAKKYALNKKENS